VNKIRVRLLKSTNSVKRGHRDTVRGLGLKRIDQVVELVDTPAVRGMINRVAHLVRIEA